MADPTRRRPSFLGRLAQLPRAGAPSEIARNLGFIFNTRKGCGSVLPDFGLGDYELASNTHQAVEVLRAELLAAVRRHEPRISEPKVHLLGGYHHDMVRFQIAGVVDGAACAFDVDIDTTTQEALVRVVEAGGR